MDISLRDYLGGHVLRKTMLHFEDAMGPWVKAEVRTHFNTKLAIPPDEDDRLAAEQHEAACEARDADKVRLAARRDDLDALIRTCPKDEKQAVAREKKAVEEELKQVHAAPAPPPPVPRWIEECRMSFGPTMKHHVNASNRWDVHTIVVVMRALLRDVFEQHLPDHFHAKELLSGILRVLLMRSTRAHRVTMAEFDVLGAMQQMVSVMQQCRCDADAVTAVSKLLEESKSLVQAAREGGDAKREGPTLSADETNAQQLYTALTAWELHIETAMGLVSVVEGGAVVGAAGRGRLAYKDGTVVFGDGLDVRWTAVVQSLKPELTVVAMARHWYFHNLQGPCEFESTFAAMNISSSAVTADAAASHAPPWHPPLVAVKTIPTTLRLHVPSVRMSVPVACVDEIVGREAMVERVTAALTAGVRVLLHGLPGVGKDTVMAEVAHRPEVQSLGGLKAWLQASSDVVLRRQFIELFATHQPRVVAGLENNVTEAIAAIKQWLATNNDWVLFVEDASLSSTTLWDVLSSAGAGGRLLVTSKEAGIAVAHTMFKPNSVFELKPITTDESIELLIKSNVLSKKAPAPPDAETEIELEQRCIAAGAADVYIAPSENERAKDQKQRRKGIETSLFERIELGRPEMRSFLEVTLGNLPLSVAQVGHMLRADTRLTGVLDLIALFRQTADLAEVDRAGTNPMLDRHYYGLSLSLRITMSRLQGADDVPEKDREDALALLSMLSLLDRTQTPLSLLSGHDGKDVIKLMLLEACRDVDCDDADVSLRECSLRRAQILVNACTGVETNDDDPLLACQANRILGTTRILSDTASLERARFLCMRYGLLQDAGEGSDGVVGVMHQLVQRYLRHAMVIANPARSMVVGATRGVLLARFTVDIETPPSHRPEIRRLAPCMQAWGTTCAGMTGAEDQVSTAAANVKSNVSMGTVAAASVENGVLLNRWGTMLSSDGHWGRAEHVFEIALNLLRRVLPPDDPFILKSMSNVASTCSTLGRHEAALKMQKEMLEIRRRVLPPDHADIATSMSDLASTYSALGRHENALKMQEDVLEFRRRVLPSDHPDISTSMSNLASTYSALGRHEDALKMQEDVLVLDRRELPPHHPHISTSMSNLAHTYSALGRHEDALKMKKDVLAFRRRVLPPDHPHIATSMNNLASTYSALGRHEDALKMKEDVLEFRRRVLPSDHPDIAASMNNVALTYSDLGKHEDALKMQKDALEFQQRVLPSDHPHIAASMSNLALTYSALGRRDDALKMHEDALEFQQRVLPPNHPHIAASMSNIASSYLELGRHEDALNMQEDVLVLERRVLPSHHPHIATSMNNLALMYSALGRHEDALTMGRDALEFRRRVLPPDHPHIAASMSNLASTYYALGQHKDALKMQEDVLVFQRRVLPPDHTEITISMSNLAMTFAALGRHEDALTMQEDVLVLQRRVLPSYHPYISTSMGNLASTYSALGRHEDALKMQEVVLAFRRRVLPPDHSDIATSMSNLAHTYSALGRHEDALKMQKDALEFLRRVLPPDHPSIAKSMSRLASAYSALGQHEDAVKTS